MWKRILALCVVIALTALAVLLFLRPLFFEGLLERAIDAAFKVRGDYGGKLRILDRGRWEEALPGLEVRTLRMGREKNLTSFDLRAVRILLDRFEIQVASLSPEEMLSADPGRILEARNAVALINGSFFDRQDRSLGLLVIHGQVVKEKPRRGADAIFCVKEGRARIVARESFEGADADFAIQSGPWLVRNGRQVQGFLKPWLVDRRSALGIDSDARVIFVATDAIVNGLSLFELSHLLHRPESKGGLGCADAVNLDGGTSTQMLFSAGEVRFQVRGFKRVPVFLLVVPKGG